MAIVNLISYLRSSRGVSDIEDQDLISFFDEIIPCVCGSPICSELQTPEELSSASSANPTTGSSSGLEYSDENGTDSSASIIQSDVD